MATLTTLESFTGTGTDGASPGYGSLLMDANGNLFGTTLSGGTNGGGTVFELVNTGSGYTYQTLAAFDGASTSSGNSPFAGLTMDSSGNLFGVTEGGGSAGSGTVFELVNTGSGYSQPLTLATFTGPNGADPTGTLVADANGNLFGTTQSGGLNGQGAVFEMVHSASGYSQPQVVYSFNVNDGAAPTGPLIADANGDLFGTTAQGGPGGQGTVFELTPGASGYTLHTLETFDGSNGSYLYAGLTADAQGDLFGTTYSGGANSSGTVFELVHSGSGYTFETIANLDYNVTGGYVIGGVTVDAQGDVYGTTEAGGANGFGTVFELVHGALGYSLPVELYSFGGADGAMPEAGLLLDANGNLLGTTSGGGAANMGTVFELNPTASNDGGAAEQANLALTVNGGSGNPIGAAGEGAVAFSVAGMLTGDTGVVTFTDAANHTVTVNVVAGQTHYTADFSTLTDGAVSASLQVATNSVGDSFTPVAGNVVTLDTVAPAQPGAPTDAAVSDGYVNAANNTAGQTIGGTAEAGASVAIYDNGTQVATALADNSGAWSYQVGALPNGAHSYAVTATDAAGNVSAMSAALSFTVDTGAPSQPAAPSDAAVSNGYVNAAHDTAGQTIGGTTEAGASVAVYDNGTQVATVVADGSGAWSYQVGALADGSVHSYAVTATNAAGNTSPMSAALSFKVDTVAPGQPAAPTDASVINGYVNAAHDTADQTIGGQTIGGMTQQDATVAVYDNGTQVATVTADNSGAWSYQVGVLADGSHHSYAVTATDVAGNTSAMSAALSFTVDTSAPAQPAAPADGAVANGYVNAAHDTAGQTIGGTTEAGASVAVYDNGTQVATVVADGSGAWSYQVGALADGSHHSYAVTATDAAGNTSAMSTALSFTVDTSAPAQPGAPTDGAVANGYVNAAHDTAGQTIGGTTEAGASVAVFDNGTRVATVVADGSGAWSYQVGALADGSHHSYAVTATDAAGNTSATSTALSFTVATSAPVQPAAPADASVSGGYVNAAHDTAGQTIGGTTEAGASVAVYDNGTQVATVTANGAGAWNYQVGTLANGSSHSYAVTATDAAGNTSAMSAALGFSVDTSAPAAPLALSDASISNGYVNAAHDTAGQTLAGTAEGGAVVSVYDNGVKLGTATANASTGAWSFNLGVLADGVQSLAATATDAAGNTGAASAALAFTVDTILPDPAVDAATVGSGGAVTVSGIAQAGATVTLYDGANFVGIAPVATDGTWTYSVGVLSAGSSHSYAVTATDVAGNTSTLSAVLSFTAPSASPGGPAVPGQPAAPADSADINGYVNAVHDTGGQTIGGTTEAGALVTIYDHGNQVSTVTADGSGAWSYQVGVLANGSSHSYSVTASNAGGVSPMSGVLSFTVDTTPPAAPTGLADTSIAGGYVNKAHDTAGQTLTGNAEAGAVVTVYDNGVKLGTTTANASTGAWTYNLGAIADGAWSLTATATDAAGNTGVASAPLTFTVDATPPVPVVDNVTGTSKGQSIVSGTSEAGSTVTLFDSGQQVGVATAGADGTWSVTLKLNGGSPHAFTETAVDLAGNTGASTGAAYWANPANKALVGASGDDVFIGSKGDTLTGGGGHNHFVMNSGFGNQTVTNFRSGSDQLWFDHTLFGNAAQVMAHTLQSGGNTVITDAAGDQLVLQGVLPSWMHVNDFLFF
jgi:uncharacterized repeat protein (TIGR03803 family)